jgi:thioredoxin-like negative regulator of GroEL
LADWQSGVDAYRNGDLAAAEQAFRQLATDRDDWYGGHYMLGRVLVARGKTAEALPELQRAFELEARPDVALMLASAALDEGQPSRAREALAAGPDAKLPAAQQVQWLSLRAQAAETPNARLRDLRAAVTLDPKDVALRLNLGDAAFDAGETKEALSQFVVADGLQSGDEAVLVRLLKSRLAISDAAPVSERAVACAEAAATAAALAKASGKASHLSTAGSTYRCAGNLEQAESFFAQAAQKEPSWHAAYDLAKVQLTLQKWQPAETALRPWLDVQGEGRTKVHQLIGRALEGRQLFKDAIPHYEIAGDTAGIAHAKKGQAALDHNRAAKELIDDIDEVTGQIGALEDEAGKLR